MKLKILIISLLSFVIYETNAQSIARVESKKMQSKALNQEREILIYTPVDYDWRVNEYFNVIYVFDSQSREFFDYATSMVSFLTDGNKSFIVVGITSPYNEKLDYGRNNDLLPVLETQNAIDRYGKYSGNAANFLNYVASEVVPFINSNYRTLNHNIAIGHSLGASFILYSLLEKPNLFENYIAISPNFSYDDNKLSKGLINFDYTKIKTPTFFYLSNADEGIEYWKEWKPARDSVYSFLRDSLKNENITVEIDEFSENNHWNTFPPSLNKALNFYFTNIQEKQDNELSEKEYEVTIKVKVPQKSDTIYIAGNQSNLGDWSPNTIKMNKISDYQRAIKLKLKSPAQFKFTRGSWSSQAEVIGAYGNITIKPKSKKIFNFKIESYSDNSYEE